MIIDNNANEFVFVYSNFTVIIITFLKINFFIYLELDFQNKCMK